MIIQKTPKRIKIGRCWYVTGYDKKPIIGLSFDKGNGYYFPTHFKQSDEYKQTGKRPNLSKDYDTAIMSFRQLQDRDKTVSFVEYNQRNIKVEKDIKRKDEEGITRVDDITITLNEDMLVQKIKEYFGKYPPTILAEKLGIPAPELVNKNETQY